MLEKFLSSWAELECWKSEIDLCSEVSEVKVRIKIGWKISREAAQTPQYISLGILSMVQPIGLQSMK